jgi:flagellar basal-body rod modification protein FlgD
MADTSTVAGGQLDKNAFLQMMVTQMQYQDPLEPMDNSQFLAQLAQFTALEQMTNLAQTEQTVLSTLQSVMQVDQLSFAHQLLGTNVQLKADDGSMVSGKVSAIRYTNGSPELVVNGQAYPLSALQEVGDEG